MVYIDNVQWSLHVEKAASLVEKCMKQYNWSRADTKNVLNAYRQLLLLKKEMSDWNATKLSPCWPIAQMWLQHSKLDDFDFDMTNLLGHVIKRTPDAFDYEEDKKRIETTMETLSERFGSYDSELWDSIQLCIVDQLGREETIDINKREPLIEHLLDYADDREEDYEKYEFVFEGKIIDDQKKESKSTDNNNKDDVDVDETPMMLGMKQGDKILASHVDQIGLTIRLDEKEHGYLVDKTSMISKTFDVFAEDIEKPEKSPDSDGSDNEEEDGVPDTSGDAALAAALAAENNNNNNNINASASSESEIGGNAAPATTKRSKYIFLLQSQRLFGFESATTLGLKSSGSIINAVHVEEHKHMNCTCCNPPPPDTTNKQADAMEEEKGSSDDDLSIDY